MRAPAVLVCAVALALPAFLLTNVSFRPYEARFRLDSSTPTYAFDLPAREPLFLEYVLTLRSPDDARPGITVQLNGQPAAAIAVPSLYAPHQAKVLLPVTTVRPGVNQLRVVIDDAGAAATFELEARLHNYYGIAPDFPRIAVVADESVATVAAVRSIWQTALQFGAFYAASVLLLVLINWVSRRRDSTGAGLVLLASPSLVLWAALAYSFATPLHIWLSLEALLVSVLVGAGLGLGGIWIAGHRAGVLRLAFVTFVSLLSLEIALRLYNVVKPSFVFYSDAYGRYRGRPGAPFFDTHFNSRGFNDVERALVRPAGVARRILAIGDSFVVGVVPYRDNYLTRLQTELAGDGSVEVINMGVAGTEPPDYLSILVAEGLAFKPDLVLVNFFIGNDFEAPRRKLFEYSYVATLARAVWRLSRERGPAIATDGGGPTSYADDVPSLSRDRFLEIEVDRTWLYERDSEVLPAATAHVIEDLRRMRDVAARGGADFVVVLIPDEAQINPDLQSDLARATGRSPDALDFDRPNRLVAAALAADGIRLLDLLPAFREVGRKVRLYRPQDTHWNLAGNELAAKTIGVFLKGQRSDVRGQR